ncbi:MAG: hypothetical protein E7618_03265 [Ruminococcaceae bacterium]|nr:hypothetical protein [Oscillospiraceae bacterium]
MSSLKTLLSDLYQTSDPEEKRRQLNDLCHLVQMLAKRRKLTAEDRSLLIPYLHSEVEALIYALPRAATYKDKDRLFEAIEHLFGIVMTLYDSAEDVPEDKRERLIALARLPEAERFLENAIDSLFEQDTIALHETEHLLDLANGITDEYHRGQLLAGLEHYRQQLYKLSEEASSCLGAYLDSELQRLLAIKEPDDEVYASLELLADLYRYFATDEMLSHLPAVFACCRSRVSFFAAETMLIHEREIPDETIDLLANDPVFSEMTYRLLQHHGLENRFPPALATPEKLSMSDLTHWLTYPTELGKAPDAIEYLGKVSFLFRKKEYYVFKFRSDSQNLDDEHRNVWLVGWSNRERGTFSHFERLDRFEKDTVAKTLKSIKKHMRKP